MIFVVAMHAGGAALSLMHWDEEEADDETVGAVAVEMVAEPVVARVETVDAPPGPVIQEALAAQTASRETHEVVKDDVPPFEPAPLAPEPEVAMPLAKPIEEEKPEEPKPEEELLQQQNANQSEASLAMAPPRVEAEPTPAPPVLSRGAVAPSRSRLTWEKSLSAHLNRFKRAPAVRVSGSVSVMFNIDKTGHLIAARVVQSSGSSVLDDEALAVLRRASPLPAAPDDVPGTMFEFTIPVHFLVKG